MCRHKSLVGRHYVFSCLQASFYKGIGRLQSSHDLHYDINAFVIDNLFKIMHNQLLCRIPRKIPEIQNIFDPHLIPRTPVDLLLIHSKDFQYAGTDCPISKYRNMYHVYSLPTIFR